MARNALMPIQPVEFGPMADINRLTAPLMQGLQTYRQGMQQQFEGERALKSDQRDEARLGLQKRAADEASQARRYQMIGNMALAIVNDPNEQTAAANWQKLRRFVPDFDADLTKNGLDPNDHRGTARMLAARAGVLPDPLERQAKQSQLANADLQRQVSQAQLQQMKLATPEKRAEMAVQYGLQAGTPAYQSFVLLGQLPAGNQSTDLVGQATQREKIAAQLGMAPGSPAYQSFVATGRMPREDQQPLSATDKKAILEADEMVMAAQNTIKGLDRAMELSKTAYSGSLFGIPGTGAGARSYVGSNAPWATPQADSTRELQNVVTTQALESLKATFGAAPTEGERKILLDIQGSVDQPQAVREAIYRRAREAAARRLQFHQQRAQELRGGTYYGGQQGGGSWRAPNAGQTPPPAQPTQQAPAQPRLRYDPTTGDLVPVGGP